MSKDIDLKSINLKPLLAKLSKKYSKHTVFAVVLLVLLAYLLVVFRISSLAGAEPTPEQQGQTTRLIPRVDPDAVQKIQSLEDNNSQIHSLLEQARDNPDRSNPFQE